MTLAKFSARFYNIMVQEELPLDVDLVTLMREPERPMGWRRAHRRVTPHGRRVSVELTILNGDGGPKEALLRSLLPETVKRPVPKGGTQLRIHLPE